MSRATQVADLSLQPYRYGALTLCGPDFHPGSRSVQLDYVRSYNPARAVTRAVWANPVSLATTPGITFVFFSSAYLDVSVRRVRPRCRVPLARRVAPFGHPRITGHLHLPAAFRSLSRPSSPPRAKASPMRPCLLLMCVLLLVLVFSLLYSCFVLSIMS